MRSSTVKRAGLGSAALVGVWLATATNWMSVGAITEYRFTDVTGIAGVANNINTKHFGATWSDYDKDGLMDLYVVNCSPSQDPTPEGANTLYRNNGDGTFTDVTEETQSGDPYCAMRNVWADYDRDGDLDFYSHNFDQSTLYQNNDNVFTDVNISSGAGLMMPLGTGAAWADYDNDGHLDLHATAFPGENALLRNSGDGTFSDATLSAGFPLSASAMGDAWADFNNDGFQDLAIAAVTAQDSAVLYLNNRDGTFTDITSSSGIVIESGGSGFAVNWLDYDNDGYLDLIFTEGALGSEKSLPVRAYLFRNNGDETFEDVTLAAGLIVPADFNTIREVSSADYDNDGYSDIYLGGTTTDMFFRNNGDGTFTDIAEELGLAREESTFAAVWADYDRDGDLDLYLAYQAGANMLFENSGGTNHWLQVELIGTTTNLDAIGSRITVTTAGQSQIREINGGTGFFSQHSPVQHFGLGGATLVDIAVHWPSGQVEQLSDVSVDQRLTLIETPVTPPDEQDISVKPNIYFGEVEVGTSADQVLMIANDGLQNLTIENIVTTNLDFTAVFPAVPFDVTSGEKELVVVSFNPSFEGVISGDLEVTSNDPDEGLLSIALIGNGVSDVPPPSSTKVHVNAGGDDFTDSNGDLFVADQPFTPGSFGFVAGTAGSVDDPVAGTADDPLYQTMRGSSASFGYAFDGLPSGDYSVTLYFTEPRYDTTGERVFDVVAEGITALSNYDIVAAGGASSTAVSETFVVNVSDGRLNLDLLPVTRVAILSGITVTTAPEVSGPDIDVIPGSLDFAEVQTNSVSDMVVTLLSNGNESLEITAVNLTNTDFSLINPPPLPLVIDAGGSEEITVRFSPSVEGVISGDLEITSDDPDEGLLSIALMGNGVSPPSSTEVHVNAGGGDFTDSNGDLFVADRPFTPGGFGFVAGIAGSVDDPVAGTADDPLYQTMRGSSASFGYAFDGLPSGDYSVTLYFTEPRFDTTGERVFDVVAEGITALSNYDIVMAAGASSTAVSETFVVNVSDGRLNLDLLPVTRVAILSGISVVNDSGGN